MLGKLSNIFLNKVLFFKKIKKGKRNAKIKKTLFKKAKTEYKYIKLAFW